MWSIVKSTLAATAAAIMLLPASAGASNVGVNDSTLTFTAAPGEANNVTVVAGASTLTVTDAGAAITPLEGCSSVSANQVTCAAADVTKIRASTGDGDDVFSMKGVALAAWLDAGAGADQLHSGSAPTTLVGGPGADVLTGGDASDIIASRDEVADSVSCGGSATDVVVADFSDAAASDCESVFRSNPEPGQGPTGTGATDTADPDGDTRDGSPNGSSGTLAPLAPQVIIPARPLPLSKRGVVTLPVACPAAESALCAGTITLYESARAQRGSRKPSTRAARRRKIARRRFKLAPGATKKIPLRLSRAGLRALRCSCNRKLDIEIASTDSAGRKSLISQTITVRARRTYRRFGTRKR